MKEIKKRYIAIGFALIILFGVAFSYGTEDLNRLYTTEYTVEY